MALRTRLFTDKEIKTLKEIGDKKWHELQKKVAGLHDEVFTEIMQAEMELAKLEIEDLEEAAPELKGTQRSLLKRMATLK